MTGMWTWDLMRLVDYVLSRDDCDPSRIACAGLSGGGLQTLLAGRDGRHEFARRWSAGTSMGIATRCWTSTTTAAANFVPGLWQAVDMGDLGALIAPRPLLVETGDEDPLNGARAAGQRVRASGPSHARPTSCTTPATAWCTTCSRGSTSGTGMSRSRGWWSN